MAGFVAPWKCPPAWLSRMFVWIQLGCLRQWGGHGETRSRREGRRAVRGGAKPTPTRRPSSAFVWKLILVLVYTEEKENAA